MAHKSQDHLLSPEVIGFFLLYFNLIPSSIFIFLFAALVGYNLLLNCCSFFVILRERQAQEIFDKLGRLHDVVHVLDDLACKHLELCFDFPQILEVVIVIGNEDFLAVTILESSCLSAFLRFASFKRWEILLVFVADRLLKLFFVTAIT